MPTARPAANHAVHSAGFGGLTEIVLPAGGGCRLVLPMLAHLSRVGDGRWLTWLAPESMSTSAWRDYGFAATVRQIHTQAQSEQLVDLFEKALRLGNSHTVVAPLPKLTSKRTRQLERLASRHDCSGLVLRYRD